MPTVKFVKEKKTIEVESGANLRKAAIKNGVQLYWGPHKLVNCMGFGSCGSCMVAVKKDETNVNKKTLWEKIRLALGPLTFMKVISHDEKDIRLACKTKVAGDIEVETHPPINWHGDQFWN